MNRAAATARLSILSNTLLIAMKFAAGIASGSVSIISEAIHSLMDLVAAVMAFFSIRIASRPADAEHQYGHGKVENVSGVVEAALIVVAAGLIIWESIHKLITRGPIDHLFVCVGVMLASGITNIVVSRRLYKVAREEQSVALAADALHLKTDVYTSLGVGIGLLVIALLQLIFRAPWVVILDPIVAMVMAAFIIREAWDMLRHAFAPLIDAAIPQAEMDALKKSVAHYPLVQVHAIRTRQAGKTRYIDFHLVVPGTMSVESSHEVCDSIERELANTLPNASVLIHVEPRFTGSSPRVPGFSKDELMASLEQMGREVAGYNLEVHHLHVFDGPEGPEITFHVAMEPGATLETTHAIASALEARVKERFNMVATVHVEPRKAG